MPKGIKSSGQCPTTRRRCVVADAIRATTTRRLAQRHAVPTPPPPPSLPQRRRLAQRAGTYVNSVKQEAQELKVLKQKDKIKHEIDMLKNEIAGRSSARTSVRGRVTIRDTKEEDNTMIKMEHEDDAMIKMEHEDNTELEKSSAVKELEKRAYENTIVSGPFEDDTDEDWIISSEDDANVSGEDYANWPRREDYVKHHWRIANGRAMAAKWSECVSRTMVRFLRYDAHDQQLLTDNGWILMHTAVQKTAARCIRCAKASLGASWCLDHNHGCLARGEAKGEARQAATL